MSPRELRLLPFKRNRRSSAAMFSRRSVLFATVALATALVAPVYATEIKVFDPASFDAAQKAGKPILVAIHASWCPTCKAQRPILSDLMAEPKFKDLVYFVVDFDTPERCGEV